jgi:hypothetical protein
MVITTWLKVEEEEGYRRINRLYIIYNSGCLQDRLIRYWTVLLRYCTDKCVHLPLIVCQVYLCGIRLSSGPCCCCRQLFSCCRHLCSRQIAWLWQHLCSRCRCSFCHQLIAATQKSRKIKYKYSFLGLEKGVLIFIYIQCVCVKRERPKAKIYNCFN